MSNLKCGECENFKVVNKNTGEGFCKSPKQKAPFLMCKKSYDCWINRTKLKCKNCSYYKPVQGYEKEEDCGGCTFDNGFYPTFLEYHCILKDEYLKQAEKENEKI